MSHDARTTTDLPVVEQTRARFLADPTASVTAPTVTAQLVNGHARLSAGPFNWDSDLPVPLGGQNHAPSPTAYLLGALAGCAVSLIANTLAPEFDVEVTALTATARCTADLAGLVGLERDTALAGLSVTIDIASDSPAERLEALRSAWVVRCPVYLALSDANAVSVTFS